MKMKTFDQSPPSTMVESYQLKANIESGKFFNIIIIIIIIIIVIIISKIELKKPSSTNYLFIFFKI
jgi:hypothetical protein